MKSNYLISLRVWIWNCRFAAVLFCVLFSTPDLLRAEEALASDLSVQFFYTCDGDVKLNRNFTIEAVLMNQGQDFSGKLQVIFPKQKNSDSIAIEKPISIKGGEEVSEKITLYLNSNIPFLEVRVIDSNGNINISQTKELVFTGYSNTLYIGIFSDHPDTLNYLGGFHQASENAKIFSLGEQIPAEAGKEYDIFDVIIVNDFDLTRFGRKQREALKCWIENGGSLIFGADSCLEENLTLFDKELTVKKIGESKPVLTDLGFFREDIEQMRENIVDKSRRNVNEFFLSPMITERRDVSMEGSSVLQADGNGILFQEVSYGKGVIQIAGINLALEPEQWYGNGTGILHMIYNNISNNKAAQMNRESYNRMYDPIYRSIDFKGKRTNYPILKYVIVYILYFSILGPILSYILKKKDRRELYWLYVPAASVLFTVIIVIMGNNTRIAEQYIGYFSMLTMDEFGKGNLETLFMAESAEHKKYRFMTEKDAEIMPMLHYTDIEAGETQKVSEKYKMLLTMEEGQTVCNMNEYASFETAYFRSNQPLISTKRDQKYYQSDLSYKQGRLEGNITVNLGYDLENACILTGNTVTAIGTLKDNIPMKIQNQKSQALGSQADLYSTETKESSILQEVTGYQTTSLVQSEEEYENYCRFQLLSYYMEQNLHTTGSYIIGFSEKPINHTLKTSDILTDGENLVILPITINDAWENQTDLLSLDSYKSIRKGSWNLENRKIDSDSIYVMYALPEHIKINQIQYTKQYNGTWDAQDATGYFGKISLYNNRTGVYDEVFTGQVEGSITDITDYVNSYNQIRVFYQPDADKSSILPILSALVDGRRKRDAVD